MWTTEQLENKLKFDKNVILICVGVIIMMFAFKQTEYLIVPFVFLLLKMQATMYCRIMIYMNKTKENTEVEYKKLHASWSSLYDELHKKG